MDIKLWKLIPTELQKKKQNRKFIALKKNLIFNPIFND